MPTFLEIIQKQVCDRLGLVRPSTVTATDLQTRQLVECANDTGDELMKEVDWTDLQTEYVIEYGAPTELAGDTTAGSRVVSGISDTSGLAANVWSVTGNGVQQSTRIASVDSATQITLTQEVDETQSAATLTFIKDTFDLPSDFDRYIDQTQWDRRYQWRMIGPQSPQEDQFQLSGVVTTGPRRKFRQIGRGASSFRIWPPPSASSDYPGTLVWEYISNQWVNKADSTFASFLTADDDEVIFPDRLLSLGIRWRFWAVKGFTYADMQAEYMDRLQTEKARRGGQRPICLSRKQRSRSYLIGSDQVQDGNFPSS